MGTLGQYLRDARAAKDIDLRDAAQQTRISIQYLRALEDEDFTKLPGEVFVRGFLKNYCRFLNLDEAEVLKRYAELKPQATPPSTVTQNTVQKNADTPVLLTETTARTETPLEPFIWSAVIIFSLLVFLFTSFPAKLPKDSQQRVGSSTPAPLSRETGTVQDITPRKLYLKIVALEDTWLLIRTDDSPQKKAVLKRGDSLTWSANERFLLSYGRVGAVQLLLNNEELTVSGAKETVVRDLAIARTGILNQPPPARLLRPMKPEPAPAVRSNPVAQPQPATGPRELQTPQAPAVEVPAQKALPPSLPPVQADPQEPPKSQ